MDVGSAVGPRIPVILVTGFLGSGKTTLVNHLIKTPALSRSAVVINEYGQVSVDHILVASPKHRTRVIDTSCLCGHVHDEVAASLLDLHEHRAHGDASFDRVLVETSGFADPVPIIQILLTNDAISTRYELRSVVTVVDGLHGRDHLAQHVESVKQAAAGDTVVITKIDCSAAEEIDRVAAAVVAINPGARQIRTSYGQIDPTDLLAGYFQASDRSQTTQQWLRDERYTETTPPASADPRIATFVHEYEGEITIPGFVLWMNLLAGFRGAGLLRVKGIVNIEGQPYAVQAVQTVISEPVPLDAWPEGHDRRSRLVFITRAIDRDEISRTFGAFRFEGGRAARNMVINPATYSRFKEAIELFRNRRASHALARI